MNPLGNTAGSAAFGTAMDLKKRFQECYGVSPRVFRAPGRVNLIGEHTDYNDGFVMPSAIEFYIWAAISPRRDRKLILHSENFSDTIEINLDEVQPKARAQWSDYIQGVAVILQRDGHHLSGANVLIQGDVPIGSGLSSSAAVEVATGIALLANSGLNLPGNELAQLCRRAENEFVGAKVGIMDPFISCSAQEGKALLLDCRSLEYRLLAIPEGFSLVICNTMVKHALASGEYNTRRQECERGVRLLKAALPHVVALRDVNLRDLESCRSLLPTVIYRRCRHVVRENARVQAAADVLKKGDASSFGRYMAESHASLRDDFEVSCPELDLMVQLARRVKGTCGARMTGGGFGGCTINLVENKVVPEFRERVANSYRKSTGLTPQIFISSAAQGASEVVTGP